MSQRSGSRWIGLDWIATEACSSRTCASLALQPFPRTSATLRLPPPPTSVVAPAPLEASARGLVPAPPEPPGDLQSRMTINRLTPSKTCRVGSVESDQHTTRQRLGSACDARTTGAAESRCARWQPARRGGLSACPMASRQVRKPGRPGDPRRHRADGDVARIC
eukprot:7924302-Pyramimonas_sp.AAC.2